MPAWLARVGLGAGATLLKKHLKEKGKELVGEARKKAITKLAKKPKPKKKKTATERIDSELAKIETAKKKMRRLEDTKSNVFLNSQKFKCF